MIAYFDTRVGYTPVNEILPPELIVGQDLYLTRQLHDHSWQPHFTQNGGHSAVHGIEIPLNKCCIKKKPVITNRLFSSYILISSGKRT